MLDPGYLNRKTGLLIAAESNWFSSGCIQRIPGCIWIAIKTWFGWTFQGPLKWHDYFNTVAL